MMRLLTVALAIIVLSPAADAQRKRRTAPTDLTKACGTDVPWRADVDAALADAKTENRPVFWYIPTVGRSPMDRKKELDGYMMSGPFSDPDIAAVLTRKFIPVKQVARGELQAKYGLQKLKFIEPGFLVLEPDGTEMFRLDKISTHCAEWWVWQLRNALSKKPALNRESAEAAAAAQSGDKAALVGALIAEGDLDAAAKAAAGLEGPPTLMARLARRRHDAEGARKWLKKLGSDLETWPKEAIVESMRLSLGQASALGATAVFQAAKDPSDEARYLNGVAMHLLNLDEDGRKSWTELVASGRDNRWTRKASAESQRLGPFVRCFEHYAWLRDDAFLENPEGTRVPRLLKDAEWIQSKGILLLLESQRANGSWDDSDYDFGGTDSLPNVYAAGTALAGIALMEFHHLAPNQNAKAVEKALTYLLDESHIALRDRNEIVWAHAYRLIFMEHYLRFGPAKRKKQARAKAVQLVKALSDSQLESGGWRHEYPNPMATASVIHALARIRDARIPTGKAVMADAAKALATTRGEDGTFSYGLGRRGRRGRAGAAVQASGGRMPLCEMAMLLAGASDQKRLRHALDTGFEQHHHLEAIRKYDDHADRYANGGFFFWYDMYGRVEAIKQVKDAKARDAYRQKMLDIVLSLTEIDGGFIDSHELGKTYGTAMGLICLKASMPERQ